jgi:UDP-2-acetamido-3-amino-2,3-dideoxy-glucuronate N-acetyltransferase
MTDNNNNLLNNNLLNNNKTYKPITLPNNPINISIRPHIYFQHPTATVDPGVYIGKSTKIWHYSHILPGSEIGEGCTIGQNVAIGPDVIIGCRCKIQNNVSIYKGVRLENKVFIGPSVVFTNILHPRAFIDQSQQFLPTLVKRGASIGANSTILCGITLGTYCFIAAGSVVTKDVPDYAFMIGAPARQEGWVLKNGERVAELPAELKETPSSCT